MGGEGLHVLEPSRCLRRVRLLSPGEPGTMRSTTCEGARCSMMVSSGMLHATRQLFNASRIIKVLTTAGHTAVLVVALPSSASSFERACVKRRRAGRPVRGKAANGARRQLWGGAQASSTTWWSQVYGQLLSKVFHIQTLEPYLLPNLTSFRNMVYVLSIFVGVSRFC